MKTFLQLVNEVVIHRDVRTNKEDPFVAIVGSAWGQKKDDGKFISLEPPEMKLDSNRKPLFTTSVPHPYGSDDPEKNASLSFGSNGILIDPKSRTVSVDLKQRNKHLDRRPNYKLDAPHKTTSRGYYKEPSRATPILGSIDNDIKPHHIKQIVKALHSEIPDLHDYDMTGDARFEGKKVHEVIAEKTPNEKWAGGREPITMYHGTSSDKAAAIQSAGLHPNSRGHSYVDLVPGYSEHNVYLTTKPSTAANYATREAVNDGSKATILKVQIHPKDFPKLRKDEDTMNWFNSSVSVQGKKQFFNSHPELKEQITDSDTHFKHHNYVTGKTGWNNEFLEKVKPAHISLPDYERTVTQNLSKAFEHSDKIKESIAFKGSIPAKQISHHATWTTRGASTKYDPSDEEYEAAMNKMQATLNKS